MTILVGTASWADKSPMESGKIDPPELGRVNTNCQSDA